MAEHQEKSPECLHIEEIMKTKMPTSPLYAFLLTPIRISGATTKGHVIARLPLQPCHMNSMSSLHGSVTATIVDWMGGMAICASSLRTSSGVSVDIHVCYQSGAKAGDEIEIEGIVEKLGSNLAFTKVNIYKVEDEKRGKLVASGTHTKFVKGA
ncbi:hypothetical protein LTR35_011419 [Friedmanniomyces endolithicus]|uniref:Thioesterase domain-containing protein n=1 Tax=Friedmanniomyces endolithicus TaxID=329885 RepID=A0AAN6FJG9_9PEZI|nr:hypothetical protein LTR35_011419 [Friedmanniomyces endolithicus]KAK0291641.1 hypothetical protein LTS00_008333 [Friedmanniomyces endolithicus]KAK0317687.1 hypothetical protein LTR82_011204 [Friedmanniomyces endolithicus]KAK0995030.1 hypothetical protein LTR54_010537 [Friedmanniomyces endolithicus]